MGPALGGVSALWSPAQQPPPGILQGAWLPWQHSELGQLQRQRGSSMAQTPRSGDQPVLNPQESDLLSQDLSASLGPETCHVSIRD